LTAATLSRREAMDALCRAANPPLAARGRWSCPIGCPREAQRACGAARAGAVEPCLWDFPNATPAGHVAAVAACVAHCERTGGGACPVALYSRELASRCAAGDAGCAAPRGADALAFGLRHFAGASDAARAGDEASEPRAELAARLAAFKRRHGVGADPG
jgi:hypothetical protein